MESIKNIQLSTLDNKHDLFSKLPKQSWWSDVVNDEDLYIEVRKENYINIYYYGGCLAKIKLDVSGNLYAETHRKYLGLDSGHRYFPSIDLLGSAAERNKIKYAIGKIYLGRADDGKSKFQKKPGHGCIESSEKWIQGALICHNREKYIDSEFEWPITECDQQLKINETDKDLRIDLVELVGDTLRFVELKRLNDSRLRYSKKKRGTEREEIINQMEQYSNFIRLYSNDLLEYYSTLLEIKKKLGLWRGSKDAIVKNIELTPQLLIANNYLNPGHLSKGKVDRIRDIEENVLIPNNINYKFITNW